MASADLKDELNCSICLEVYKDPVTLRCGHNFCQVCINQALDRERSQGVYSCPQCRSTFRKRPWLQKNVTLANIAERVQSTPSPSQPPGQKKTGVICSYCIHAPVDAVKSCLHCEASLCNSHLNTHSKSPEHILVEPSASLKTIKCPVHKKLLEYYCTVDATCICASCKQSANHRGHQVQTLHEASKKKKERLKITHDQLIARKKDMETWVHSLQESKKKANEAASMTKRVAALFRNIREKLDILEVQEIDNITRQVEQNLQPVSDLIRRQEIKKDEISSKICHLEELFNTTDPLTVLQEQETNRGDFSTIEKRGRRAVPTIAGLDEVEISLKLRKRLSDILADVPKMLKFPELADVRLDKDTAATNVAISSDYTIAYGTQVNDDIDDTDDRFESHQVISRKGLSNGCHYWEVELSDTNNWRVGMSYENIDRDGSNSVFGNTYESWCLCKSNRSYSLRHDSDQLNLSLPSSFKRFRRLGIYLDYDEGKLSFYSVEPDIMHLHTYNTDFSQPLHAAIRVGYDVWVKIVQ
ncbi:E3 ubiquitin/ISG15 ligase TRIM25-like [Hyperolius riggenbachi]|uniref:E3 ubiquitin/ISG15 ligase TRIM25-like n=1 Tax=Hyperolius riggenbachi TaxID=752182 RepID=UPI0035A2D7EE